MSAETVSPQKVSVLAQGFRNELELLARHIRMLQFVQKHGPIGIIRLGVLLGVPKHKVRYSLRILEKEGYIRPSTQGAMTTEKVADFFESMKALLTEFEREIHQILGSLKRDE